MNALIVILGTLSSVATDAKPRHNNPFLEEELVNDAGPGRRSANSYIPATASGTKKCRTMFLT